MTKPRGTVPAGEDLRDEIFDVMQEYWSLSLADEEAREGDEARELQPPKRCAAPASSWVEALAGMGEFDVLVGAVRLTFCGRQITSAAGQARIKREYALRDPTAKIPGIIIARDAFGRSLLCATSTDGARLIYWRGGSEGEEKNLSWASWLAPSLEDLRDGLRHATKMAERASLSEVEQRRISQAIRKHAQEAAGFEPGDRVTRRRWQTRFGGVPPLAADQTWPVSDGLPVPFVFQLYVHPDDDPDEGKAESSEGVYAVFFDDELQDEKGFVVRWIPKHDQPILVPPPNAADHPARDVEYEVIQDEPTEEHLTAKERRAVYRCAEPHLEGVVWDHWRMMHEPWSGNKIGGYPAWQQEPAVPKFGRREGEFFFQLAFGSFRLYVFLDPDDPTKLKTTLDID